MYSLIMTVLSIGLFGAFAASTIQYFPIGAIIRAETAETTVEGFQKIEAMWSSYRDANETYAWVCDTFTSPEGNTYEDCSRELDTKGYLPSSSWVSSLQPEHGFIPATPGNGGQWIYATNGSTQAWFCLKGDYSVAEREGLESAASSFSPDAFFLSSGSCGATADTVFSDDYSGPVRVTYWLDR